MKLHYAGKYLGNPNDLPYLEHEPGAVPFKEARDLKQLSKIMFVIALVIGSAAGDFYNVFNALTQVPKNAFVYNHKESTYWFIPGQM